LLFRCSVVDQSATKRQDDVCFRAGDKLHDCSVWGAPEESFVTQAEATAPSSRATAVPHHHQHHYRHSTASLLGASVFTRLAFVAGLAAVLWAAILWALA
jgi:hypothetical protein